VIDLINATFELSGGAFITLSVRKLLRDKQVRGIHWGQVAFFTVWGFWNLPFYGSLGQWYSMVGSLGVCLANCIYLAMLWRFRRS
jgi:hypothetical protein